MNINQYPEIKSGKKLLKKIYVAVMLFIVGRAIQAASKLDKNVKEEFAEMPDDFTFSLCVHPAGPCMIVGKNKKGKVKYMGWNKKGKKIGLGMSIKSLEAAFLIFSFQESTAVAFAHDRFIIDGNLSQALAVVRILNFIEVFLLPGPITKLAVKRYPKWSEMNPLEKWIKRILVYVRAFTF